MPIINTKTQLQMQSECWRAALPSTAAQEAIKRVDPDNNIINVPVFTRPNELYVQSHVINLY